MLPREARSLTEEQIQILAHLGEGRSAGATAALLGISERLLRHQMRKLCCHLGASSPSEVVAWAVRRGLV